MYRSKFGQDILMVHLQMSEEDVTKRLAARHAGNEKSQEILMVNSKYDYHLIVTLPQDVTNLYTMDDVGDNVVVVKIKDKMGKEDIMDLVLAEVDKYFTDKC